MKYVAPESGVNSFTCPHCGVLAQQDHWYNAGLLNSFAYDNKHGTQNSLNNNPVRVSKCHHCKQICLWHFDTMVYPNRGNAPMPNPDMPDDIRKDYEEAASIATLSPRGAAALLRLAIQKLCNTMSSKDRINDQIQDLVDNHNLPIQIQKALDIVRVLGNNAVHPGQIDVENSEVGSKLFGLLNMITEYVITQPKEIDKMFNDLPETNIKGIENRGRKKSS